MRLALCSVKSNNIDFLISPATFQSSSYPIVLTKLGWPRSRPSPYIGRKFLHHLRSKHSRSPLYGFKAVRLKSVFTGIFIKRLVNFVVFIVPKINTNIISLLSLSSHSQSLSLFLVIICLKSSIKLYIDRPRSQLPNGVHIIIFFSSSLKYSSNFCRRFCVLLLISEQYIYIYIYIHIYF